MSQIDLTAFQNIVLQDPARQAELRELLDETVFTEAVCAAARACGLDVQAEDVQAGLQTARRAWIERWIT
jgi:hypothetical protein